MKLSKNHLISNTIRNTSPYVLLLTICIFAFLITLSCGDDDEPKFVEITGTVTSKSGQNIDPVTITIVDIENPNSPLQTTSTQGTFTKGGLSPARYQVTAKRAGYADYEHPVVLNLLNESEKDITIEMIPLGTVSGVITNANDPNLVVTGANVKLTGQVSRSTLSDTNGSFNFTTLNKGTYKVEFSAQGYRDLEEEITIDDGENTPLNVQMTPFPSISGTVFNREDDSPIPDVKVTLESTTTTDVLTDASGEFRFTELEVGTYKLKLDKLGFEQVEENINLEEGQSINKVYKLLPVEVFSSVSGIVQNAETQTPMPNVTLSLSGLVSQDVLTDVNGEYSFNGLDPGAYRIKAEPEGFSPFDEVFQLSLGEDKNLIISLEPLPYISGVVLNSEDDSPLENVEISLSGSFQSDMLTDETGRFLFPSLQPGQYTLGFAKQGFKSGDIPVNLTVGNPVDKVIKLEPLDIVASVSGTVRDQETQAGIPNLKLSLSGPVSEDILTSSTGDYSFKNLLPGVYTIKISHEGYVSDEQSFTLADSEDKSLIISLTPLGLISGVIFDADNDAPIKDAEVTLIGDSSFDKLTNDQGQFTFDNLTPGRYTLQVKKQDYISQEEVIDLNPGQEIDKIFKLTLAPVVASVFGKVIHSETQAPIPDVKLSLTGPATKDQFTDENGNYLFDGIPVGSYSIITNLDGFEQKTEEFTLVQDEAKNLIISLDPVSPELNVSPTILDFLDTQNSLTIDITNSKEGTLNWDIIEDIPWLIASKTSGTVIGSASETVTLTANRDLLNQGSYANFFTISSNGGSIQVNAKIEVKSLLCVTPTDLNFGTGTNDKSVSLENCGNGTIDYTIVTDHTWLKVSPQSGTVTNEKDPITISVDHTGLAPDNYTGQVIFNSPTGATEVVVVMTVPDLNNPQITLSDESLDFGTSQATRVITVTNTGRETLNWNLAKEQSWISISKANGTLEEGESEDINVEVFRGGLAPNDYQGNLDFTSNGGQESVPVTMTVAATPILELSTQFLDFGSEINQLTFDITNIGNSMLQWDVSADVNWINVVPNSGANAGQVTVFVKRDLVGFGGYNGNITINSNGGVQGISVSMLHTPPPPNMVLDGVDFKSDENESGTPNPGETVTYTIRLKNDNGASTGEDIRATFQSPGPYVNSLSPVELSFGSIGINETVERDINIHFSSIVPVGERVPINMNIIDKYGKSWSESFEIEIKSFFIVPQGLLAYYKFDESDFRDETGNYPGFGFGPEHTSDSPDGVGLSIEFNADEGDFFQTAKNIIQDQTSGSFNFWLKTESNNFRLFTSSLQQTYERNRIYISDENKVSVNADRNYYSTRFTTDVSGYLLDNTWHMLTITITEGLHQMFVDGQLIEQNTGGYRLYRTDNSEGFAFGKRSGEEDLFYNGKMDNIRIYNRVLTEEEVALLFEKKQ